MSLYHKRASSPRLPTGPKPEPSKERDPNCLYCERADCPGFEIEAVSIRLPRILKFISTKGKKMREWLATIPARVSDFCNGYD